MTILAAVRLTQRIVVVGGGVLGTMHAVMARRRGYEVVHLEREAEARGASVRNFGLVWVSGRRAGAELGLALRARELWQELSAAVPGLGFRPAGSLTLATDDAELQVLKEAAALSDAGRRGFELLDPGGVREVNPVLRGELAGGLLCRADAIVEPRQVLPALRGYLAGDGDGYQWRPGREVTEIAPNAVRDHTGVWHQCDLVVLCTGAAFTGVAGRYQPFLARDGVRRVRLQMMQTAPLAERLTTAVADGDSLRYYPAYDVPGRSQLPPQPPAAERARAQLLLVQRADGGLDHRRHPRIRRAVRVRPGLRRLRSPPQPGRGTARRPDPAHPAPLGRGLQRGHPACRGPAGRRSGAVPQIRARARRRAGHRARRAGHDLRPGHSGGDVPMTRITVACLDMAGTTVRDDGTVLDAFTSAIAAQNLPVRAFSQAMKDVRSSMGQSKIEVFRRILGDERAAQQTNEAFEQHYAAAVRAGQVAAMPGAEEVFKTCREAGHPGLPGHRVLAGHPGRHHRRAGLGRPGRPGPVARRRGLLGTRPPLAGPAADRAAAAARRRGQRARGGRRHRQRRGVRAARRGRGRSGRADRRRLAGGPGESRRAAHPRLDRRASSPHVIGS